ncbi:MAG: hypothetical protein ABI181_13990 [Mycobacteriaceae bacterium]
MSAAALLHRAAFGDRPGEHPLPGSELGVQRWERAVALGGQGRYAAAAAELGRLDTADHAPELRSLALSTRASHRRQLGNHTGARGDDGAALVLAGSSAQARCDALVGLAADALGPGRVRLARALLARARAELGEAPSRCEIRWCWVAAETELVAGQGAAARGHAHRGRELAESGTSLRHQVKSGLVLAATLSGAPATELAENVLAVAEQQRLIPLVWACTLLLAESEREGGRAPCGRASKADLHIKNTVSHGLITQWGAMLLAGHGTWPTRPG